MRLETRSYTDFTNRLHGRVGGRRIPLDVSIEITRRCPLQCAHCYNNLPMADREARRRELGTDEHVRLLDELADAGGLWLLFTGGEIFARADFLDIYLHAKRRGFLITLFTNGTLITERIADTLVEYRPFAIEITLYGRTRETYERLTGVPGSYDRCLRGIRLLKERGLPLSLKTVAVTSTATRSWDMKRFVEEELGLPFKFDAMMTPRIDCSASPLEVRLRPEEIVELDLADPVRMRDWALFARDFIRPQQAPGHENDVYHCGGGCSRSTSPPHGNMSICVLSQQGGLDLRTGSVERGLDGLPGGRARAADAARHQVQRLPAEERVRDVPGQRRARGGRPGDAGRLPVPRSAPARAHVRLGLPASTGSASTVRAARSAGSSSARASSSGRAAGRHRRRGGPSRCACCGTQPGPHPRPLVGRVAVPVGPAAGAQSRCRRDDDRPGPAGTAAGPAAAAVRAAVDRPRRAAPGGGRARLLQDGIRRRAARLALPLRRELLDDRLLSASSYTIRVAGLVVSVTARRPGAPVECLGRSRAFLVDAGHAELHLEAVWSELDSRSPGRLIFDSGGVWRAYESLAEAARPGARPELVLRFHDPRLPFPYKEARLEAGGSRGLVRLDPRAWPPGQVVDPLEYPLDELLFQRLLGARGGIELHAVGVVAPSGRGYVFAGQSGDGKTTSARLWQEAVGAAVLSDDRIVLTREDEGGWLMHGTPWHGEAELALPASAPLAGVFVLARGAVHALEPLAPARAVAALLARSFPAFHDAAATQGLVRRLEALVADVPCRRFAFVPDTSAVRYFLDHAP